MHPFIYLFISARLSETRRALGGRPKPPQPIHGIPWGGEIVPQHLALLSPRRISVPPPPLRPSSSSQSMVSPQIYMCVCIHTHTNYIYTHLYIYIYICLRCKDGRLAQLRLHRIWPRRGLHAGILLYMYIYIYIYVCVWVSIYIYIQLRIHRIWKRGGLHAGIQLLV